MNKRVDQKQPKEEKRNQVIEEAGPASALEINPLAFRMGRFGMLSCLESTMRDERP